MDTRPRSPSVTTTRPNEHGRRRRSTRCRLARTPALVLAICLSALVLFGVGAYSAVTLVGDWRTSGAKMLVIGLGAARVGFLIGNLFHAA